KRALPTSSPRCFATCAALRTTRSAPPESADATGSRRSSRPVATSIGSATFTRSLAYAGPDRGRDHVDAYSLDLVRDARVGSVALDVDAAAHADRLALFRAARHQPAHASCEMPRTPRHAHARLRLAEDQALLGVIVGHDRDAESEVLDHLRRRADVEERRAGDRREADVRLRDSPQRVRVRQAPRDLDVRRER